MMSTGPSRIAPYLLLALMMVAVPALAGGGAAKVDICHLDDEGNVVLINISANAVDRHLRNHGDFYPLTFYTDADTDGFGDASTGVVSCTASDGYVDNGNDCDDSDPAVNPGASESCNGIDDNCNGEADEGDVCGVDCLCLTPGSAFEAVVLGNLVLEPNVNGLCANSDSTAIVYFFSGYATAAGGEADTTGSGRWACESTGGGYRGNSGFIGGLSPEEARACGDLVRKALVASGVDPATECEPW